MTTNALMELAACPFCGGSARLECCPTDDEATHWWVQCFGCGATNGETLAESTPDQEFAIAAWNTRPALRTAASGVPYVESLAALGAACDAYYHYNEAEGGDPVEYFPDAMEAAIKAYCAHTSPPGAEARDAGSLGLEVAYTEARVWKAEAMAARKLCDDWNKSAIAEGYGLGNVRACELLQAMDAAREAHEAKEESDAAIDAALRAREAERVTEIAGFSYPSLDGMLCDALPDGNSWQFLSAHVRKVNGALQIDELIIRSEATGPKSLGTEKSEG